MSRDHSRLGASLLLSLSLRREPPLILDSIDNMLERPLLSLYNPLLAEDEDVPDVDFALFGSIIEEDDTPLEPARSPRQIDDELVTRMKRPIDLPDVNYQSPDYSNDDYGGLVEATSAISLRSRHHPLQSPRSKHREHPTASDAFSGSICCNASLSLEPPDAFRRPRSFGHTRH